MPPWPEAVLGPIDQAKAEQGRQLFLASRRRRPCPLILVVKLREYRWIVAWPTLIGIMLYRSRISLKPADYIHLSQPSVKYALCGLWQSSEGPDQSVIVISV